MSAILPRIGEASDIQSLKTYLHLMKWLGPQLKSVSNSKNEHNVSGHKNVFPNRFIVGK